MKTASVIFFVLFLITFVCGVGGMLYGLFLFHGAHDDRVNLITLWQAPAVLSLGSGKIAVALKPRNKSPQKG